MNQQHRIELLASKYWDATISQIETIELRQLLLNGDEPLSEEIKVLKIMLLSFESMKTEIEADNKLELTLPITTINREVKPSRSIKLMCQIAAAVAVVCGVAYMLAINTTHSSKELDIVENEVLCYINNEPITDLDIALEQIKYIEQLDKLSHTITTLESILNN